MDKKIIDNIVWWIPFKKIRNSVRELMLYNLETRDLYNDINNRLSNLENNINNKPNNVKNNINLIYDTNIIEKEFNLIHPIDTQKDLLFYTCCNEPYYPFAIIYPIFAIISNPDSIIEIGINDYDKFYEEYSNIIEYYNTMYKNQVYFHNVTYYKNIFPNTIRFITQPHYKCKYVYIGDIDILILENILEFHLNNIKNNRLDFSNHKRPNLNYLTGLHFIEYDKMYPIILPKCIDINKVTDEELLFYMMKERGYKITDIIIENDICMNRPTHGYHASYFSRPPLNTITTRDKKTKIFPGWTINKQIANKYMQIRYSKEILDLFSFIKETNIELRKIIQYIDLTAFYILNNKE